MWKVNTKKISKVRIAAGNTILKFSLNLALISHPCVRVAAIVVSEIIDKLSPNMAPQITAPTQSASGIDAVSLIPTAIGVKATTVPTEVPIEIEIKQAMIKIPTTAMFAGRILSPKFTALVAPPAAVTDPENAPANKNTKHIIIIFSSPAPLAAMLNFSEKLTFLFCKNATIRAIIKPTGAGIL